MSAFRYIAEDGKEILGENSGIEILMNIAHEHADNCAVIEQGVGAISNLAEDNVENAYLIIEYGVHTLSVNAMTQHTKNCSVE